MFRPLKRLADRLRARRDRRGEPDGPAPAPIDPPADGHRPGLLERLLMFAISTTIKTAFQSVAAWYRNLVAPIPGAVKGTIDSDGFQKLITWIVHNTTLTLALATALDYSLDHLVAAVPLFIANPFVAGLVVMFLTTLIGGMRLKNQGVAAMVLPAGTTVPAGGALSPPPAALAADELAAPPPSAIPVSRLTDVSRPAEPAFGQSGRFA